MVNPALLVLQDRARELLCQLRDIQVLLDDVSARAMALSVAGYDSAMGLDDPRMVGYPEGREER